MHVQPEVPHQVGAGGDDSCRVGHVLQHFHAGQYIEAAGCLLGHGLHGHFAVLDIVAGFMQVQAGGGQNPRGYIDTGDLCTLVGQ